MKIFKSFTILLFYCILSAFSSDRASEYAPSSLTITANPTTTTDVEPAATNIILQSNDGGQTWQDISQSLPENEQPEGFFAGESDIYVRVADVMYRSKSNLKTPVWEKENVPDPQSVIAFNRSGVLAFNREGQIYRRMSPAGNWAPTYTNLKKNSVQIIFETSDGTVLVGSEGLLYKSTDKGQSWKKVQNAGLVMDIVESEGVLVGTGKKGIIRSTDNGENWQLVIRDGGFGIAIERIEGGFAAIDYNTTIKTRRVHLSFDNGKTWKAVEGLPPSSSISSIKQVGKYLICGHPDGIFRSSDMGKTWNIVHTSADNPFKISLAGTRNDPGRVFNLYVSGNIVYAVAESGGC